MSHLDLFFYLIFIGAPDSGICPITQDRWWKTTPRGRDSANPINSPKLPKVKGSQSTILELSPQGVHEL